MANRYTSIQIESGSINTDPRYYLNAIYPEIEATENDFYVITTAGDRLDILAAEYYQDPNLWWIISSANRLPGNSLYPTVGTQLRIPSDVSTILANFLRINKLR